MLATASWDNTCKLFDLRRRREITTLRGHLLSLFGVLLARWPPLAARHGRRPAAPAAASSSGTWKPIAKSLSWKHPGPEWSCGALPPERRLVAVHRWSAIHLWRAPSWAEIDAEEKRTEGKAQ